VLCCQNIIVIVENNDFDDNFFMVETRNFSN